MEKLKSYLPGMGVCLAIAAAAWMAGRYVPVVGGAVFAILIGMVIALFWDGGEACRPGIAFTSKKILQAAVVLLGFGLDLNAVVRTGAQSLPIIISTIAVSLIIAYAVNKIMRADTDMSIMIGVGSSICGGSAIAATASVIKARDEDVAQAVSVIFFFNVIAALVFPALGHAIGFDTASGEAFGIFAGTAVNDTSSVTATAATWDSMWGLGTETLDKAVTVKLTRTLAIIPITLVLALWRAKRSKKAAMLSEEGGSFSFRKAFPMFILWFVCASLFTTVCLYAGVPSAIFAPLKELSKFMIIMAMAAIGLGSNIIKLVKSGGKPIFTGACCWVGITLTSLLMQHVMGIW